MHKLNHQYRLCSLALILASFTVIAETSIEACKLKNSTASKYSICLDEAMKKKDRELKSWIKSKELALQSLAEESGRSSVLTQFQKANTFYLQFIESECRSVFFEKQDKKNPADEYRICKIEQANKRIKQMKESSKK